MYGGTCRGGVNSGDCSLEGAAPRPALISHFLQKRASPLRLRWRSDLRWDSTVAGAPERGGVFTDAAVRVTRARNNKAGRFTARAPGHGAERRQCTWSPRHILLSSH